ncbi:MAG: TlyA family rRNA (cytidine-2'-O)-methyltransferase [Rhodospirillaceae bacterium]|nr:TlyA family rRNA (cytidine-2'-O)-methyltransferase [Rhodospirillaceae bacterium]
MIKDRLDQILVHQGLADNRSKAQALIMAGLVFTGERRLDKAGLRLSIDTDLTIRGKPHPWVSRGGLKLDHALNYFAIEPKGFTALDIGASTGGFTDVLIARGARRVYAVDVGYGQLALKLRDNDKVTVMDKVNARYLDIDQSCEKLDIIVCDASFISLSKVLQAVIRKAKLGVYLIALIKPQFEVGKSKVGRKGIVSDPLLHIQVCDEVSLWLQGQLGWNVMGIVDSPIKGQSGNKEFMICGMKTR